LVASHDGYQRLEPPATHRRYVVSLRNGVYLVRDVVTGQGKRRLDVAWHLGQELQLVEDGLFRVKGASLALGLMPAQGHGWAEEVRRESWSPAYGLKAPMTTLNFGAEVQLPAEFSVLLVTLEEAHPGAIFFARMENATADSNVCGYRYAGEGLECSFLFGERGKSWRMGLLSSDAEFVCWKRRSDGGGEELIFCDGSYAQVEGGVELSCARPVEWAEVILKAGDREVFSSDMAAVEATPTFLQPSNPAPESSE